MKWIINKLIKKKDVYLRVTTCERLLVDDQQRMFNEISALPEWTDGMPILFDNRLLDLSVSDSNLIRDSVQVLLNFCRKNPATKIAGLVDSTVNFGFGRQFEIIFEIEGGVKFHLFRDEIQALGWLMQPELGSLE
ncbi:MAG: hypothetical protein JSS81_13910 [Acidobacteria bacterium]|nr:hypothetical protein [Acidobacteriota bacterium]